MSEIALAAVLTRLGLIEAIRSHRLDLLLVQARAYAIRLRLAHEGPRAGTRRTWAKTCHEGPVPAVHPSVRPTESIATVGADRERGTRNALLRDAALVPRGPQA